MQRAVVSGLIVSLALIAGGQSLRAADADEYRERAEDLLHKAAIAAKEGLEEEAEQMQREAEKLRHAAALAEKAAIAEKIAKSKEKSAGHPAAVRQLKKRLEGLRDQEQLRARSDEAEIRKLHEHIATAEHKLQEIARHADDDKSRPERQSPQERLEQARRRLHHLRVAVENLKLADMPDLAEQVAEKAEATERELQDAAERMAVRLREEHEKRAESDSDRNRDLQEAVEQLRAEVKELRKRIEDDD